MMRTSFLLSLMYMVIVGVSHSQTMKVVWEKQLVENEKFLAISKDDRMLLIYNMSIQRLMLWNVETDSVVDTLSLPEIISADFSTSGNHIACSATDQIYLIETNPLKVKKKIQIPKEFYVFKTTELVYVNGTENKVYCGLRSMLGDPWSYIDGGYVARIDFEKGSVDRVTQLFLPSYLQVSAKDESLLYYATRDDYEDYPGQPYKHSTEEFTYMFNRTTEKKNHRKSVYERPLFFYNANYVLYEDCLVDFYNFEEKKITPKLSSLFGVLGNSSYIVENDGVNMYLRYIKTLHSRIQLTGDTHSCIEIKRCNLPNEFVTISHDSILRICAINELVNPDSLSVVPNFRMNSNGIRTGESIQFVNTSFPLNEKCSFLWDFGDGTQSTDRDPKHVYDEARYYTVTLSVWDQFQRLQIVTKKDIVFVTREDTNIVLKKKFPKTGINSVKYSSDGKRFSLSNDNTSYVIETKSMMIIDSSLLKSEYVFSIQYEGKDCILSLGNFKEKINGIHVPSYITFDVTIKSLQNSELLHKYSQKLLFPSSQFELYNNRRRIRFVNDTLFVIERYYESKIPYTVPEIIKSSTYRVFNINDTLFVPPKTSYLSMSVLMDENEAIDDIFVFTPQGIKNNETGKVHNVFSFKNVVDTKKIDSNSYVILTKDFATPVILCNIAGDTLHLFRSVLTPQSCIDINPINNQEFITADSLGNVTLWKIPPFKNNIQKPVLVDFIVSKKKQTIDSIMCLPITHPSFAKAHYEWDFGDGTQSIDIQPTHHYKSNGDYTVRLHYRIPNVIDTVIEKKMVVTIRLTPLSINFTTDNNPQNKNSPVTFKNTTFPLHPSFTYVWDFGDGNLSSEIHPSHTYSQEGVYTVKLTIQRKGLPDTSIEKTNYVIIKKVFKIREITSIPSSIHIGDSVRLEVKYEPADTNIRAEWYLDNTIIGDDLSMVYIFRQHNEIENTIGQMSIRLVLKFDTLKIDTVKILTVLPLISTRILNTLPTVLVPITLELTPVPNNGMYHYNINWGDTVTTIAHQGMQVVTQHLYKRSSIYPVIINTKEMITNVEITDTIMIQVFPDNQRDFVNPTLSTGESIVMQTYGVDSKMSIFSMTGTLIRQWEYTGNALHEEIWNLEDEYGNRIAAGMYYIVFKNENIQSSVIPVIIMY